MSNPPVGAIRPPIGAIRELLSEGKVVPFLGAGVNVPIDPLPSGPRLPSGKTLSRLLARESSFPSDDEHDLDDLAKVSSYFAETVARTRLRDRLRKVFGREYTPAGIHQVLAENPKPLLIVTTNYDDLLESAFRERNIPFDLVVHPTDRRDAAAAVFWWQHGKNEPDIVPPNKLYIDLDERFVIYKMHGSIHRSSSEWDSYVITEEDYVEFLSRMTARLAVPSQFMNSFRERHFLFLGYALRDWNLRVILRNLQRPQRGPVLARSTYSSLTAEAGALRSWAIQYQPTKLETALWHARGVHIYDVSVDEFVQQLRNFDSRVDSEEEDDEFTR